MAINGDSSDATITAIFANRIMNLCDGHDYCAFGVDADGNDFYCEINDTGITKVWVYGSDHDDTVNLQYVEGGVTYVLNTHSAGTLVTGVVGGGLGVDTILGSTADTDYDDELHGDDGNDVIDGDDGDDLITGDAGGDTIEGGPGNDTIHGNGGVDILNGGDDEDTIFGGADNDLIMGDGDDDPILDGQSGNDTVCGYGGIDKLHGGSGDDVLWAGPTAGVDPLEETNGGTDSDICQHDGNANPGCETKTVNMAQPAACP